MLGRSQTMRAAPCVLQLRDAVRDREIRHAPSLGRCTGFAISVLGGCRTSGSAGTPRPAAPYHTRPLVQHRQLCPVSPRAPRAMLGRRPKGGFRPWRAGSRRTPPFRNQERTTHSLIRKLGKAGGQTLMRWRIVIAERSWSERPRPRPQCTAHDATSEQKIGIGTFGTPHPPDDGRCRRFIDRRRARHLEHSRPHRRPDQHEGVVGRQADPANDRCMIATSSDEAVALVVERGGAHAVLRQPPWGQSPPMRISMR